MQNLCIVTYLIYAPVTCVKCFMLLYVIKPQFYKHSIWWSFLVHTLLDCKREILLYFIFITAQIIKSAALHFNFAFPDLGLDIQDDLGRHEVGFVDNTEKEPINDNLGCRFKADFKINKVIKYRGTPSSLWHIYIAGDGLGHRPGFQSHSCSWQLGLNSESDSVQCENFCIVQCSHWVSSPNPSLNK